MLRSISFKNLRTRARKLDPQMDPRQTGLAPSFLSTHFAFWALVNYADWSLPRAGNAAFG
jgi:hypothetical protein